MTPAQKGAQRASFDPNPAHVPSTLAGRQRRSSRGTRALLRAVAVALPVIVVAAPIAAHDGTGRVLDRRLAPHLAPGAVLRDNGITVTVPARGSFVWAELKHQDGTHQEVAVETTVDGRVYVSGRGDERAATLRNRLEAAALGIDGRLDPDVGRSLRVNGGVKECNDRYRNLYWWRTPRLNWRFNPRGTPSSLLDKDGGTTGVQTALERAQKNITGSYNKCGRSDRVAAKGSLIGTTRRSPNVSSGGSCRGGDGHSVIGFGDLPSYSIAMACVYGVRNGVAVEADILINGVDTRWALSRGSCSGSRLLLEAAMTHEFGHAYGLAHASTYRNPWLTMQPLVRACSTGHASLGLGDMLGLEKKY